MSVWVVTRTFHNAGMDDEYTSVVGVYSSFALAVGTAVLADREFGNIAYDCEICEVMLDAAPEVAVVEA